MKNKTLIPITLCLAIVTLAAYRTAVVYAQGSNNKYPPIIGRLVERFSLDKEEVKAVFDEVREDHQQEMQNRFNERLGQAISEGKITAEQKELILQKREELRGQRQENWQSGKEELEKWAEDNNIDSYYLFGFKKSWGRGFRAH
ncbi:MAG: hypothetical protein ABIB61_04240 [Candidatus Shapirobacteria bacterium]